MDRKLVGSISQISLWREIRMLRKGEIIGIVLPRLTFTMVFWGKSRNHIWLAFSAIPDTSYNMSNEKRVMQNCPFMDFSLTFLLQWLDELEIKQYSQLLLGHGGFECRCRTRLSSSGVSQMHICVLDLYVNTVGVLPTHYVVTTRIWVLFFFYSVEGVYLSVCDLMIVWAGEVDCFELPCHSYFV